MPPPASGVYAILSALMGDHRFVQNNNGLLQLEYVRPGSGYSGQQKFQVTLTGDGTYTIAPLAALNSGIWYQMDQSGDPESGDFILYVYGNGAPVRWRIEQAPRVGNPTVMNIIGVHGIADVPLARYPLWNRIDGDDAGRLQLVNPGGGPDPHNNWIFLPA